MTPKEKALSICQKIGGTTIMADDCNEGYSLPLRVSKLIATILVEEMLQIHGSSLHQDYWHQVKQEIEKL